MMQHSYQDRISRVVDHIHAHIDQRLSLDVLADVAAMSPYHWHRVYHAMTGETCAQTVRRIRLHRAAMLLVQTDDPVDHIARRVGYPVLRSFNRAFADRYRVTPLDFRARGAAPRLSPPNPKQGDQPMLDTEIVTQPAQRMAALRHQGAYHEIGQTFTKLGALLAEADFFPNVKAMAAVYYDDPMVVPEPDLRSDAGFFVAEGVDLPAGLTEVALPAGRVARFDFRGHYSGLAEAYTWIYATWLPASGEEPADFPSYEVYINSPMDTAPDDLITHIFLPLK